MHKREEEKDKGRNLLGREKEERQLNEQGLDLNLLQVIRLLISDLWESVGAFYVLIKTQKE